MSGEDGRSLAKCNCGATLVWAEMEGYGDIWVHWKPTEEAAESKEPHILTEGSIFWLSEDEFEEWDQKSPKELEEYFGSMLNFTKDIK